MAQQQQSPAPQYRYASRADKFNSNKRHYFRTGRDGSIQYNQGTTRHLFQNWQTIDLVNFEYAEYYFAPKLAIQ